MMHHPIPPVSLLRRLVQGRALLVPLTALALAGQPATQTSGRLPAQFPQATRGAEAIETLGARLALVAADNDTTAAVLRERLLTDETLWVDAAGRLFYVDAPPPALPDEDYGASVGHEDIPPSQAFLLHSRPGADHVIHLDFDGHHSVNNGWGHNIMFPAYDVNGDASMFTTTELNNIIAQWKHVSEDFAPFEVDVTTEEPPLHRLEKNGGGDTQWGVRCVFTQATQGFGNGIGGIAFLNSFDDSIDNPVFAFNKKNNNGGMTGSHEVGHALGLSHDGLNSSSYHPGAGQGQCSWGPIMGAPFFKKLVQWSNGDYSGATNTENDYNIITKSSNGVTFKADDHPDTLGAGTPVDVRCPVPASVSVAGLIERRTDVDVFELSSLGGVYRIEVDHAEVGRNLDILLEVFDATGALVASDNPFNEPDANLTATLPPGDYSIRIDGTERLPRYSDYGTVGVYTLHVLPQSGFDDLGSSLAGSASPALAGQGFPCAGDPVSLDMTGGLPDTLTLLAFGRGQANMPFKGGTLVPDLGMGSVIARVTDGSGAASVGQPWPAGVGSGTAFVFQYWQPDPGGPQGWSATNAVEITAP